MTEPQPRKLRTWSAFGDIKRVPSEYEIGTHGLNYTARKDRKAALESSPTTPVNLWLLTYRDKSPLSCDDWDGFRDPDQMTYRKYVELQAEQENMIEGVIEEYEAKSHDAHLSGEWVAFLGRALCPMRYPNHAIQMTQAYIGSIAASSYVIHAAAFAAADMLRRNTVVATRTRQLQKAWPDAGFGINERGTWETDPAWQPLRRAVETALVAYDWGEALTVVNLALRPAVDFLLLNALGEAADKTGDGLTWLLLSNLAGDSARNRRWSTALARYAIAQRSENRVALVRWLKHWQPRIDDAVAGLAELVASAPGAGATREVVVKRATQVRREALAEAGLS